jgi:hypothetical protein
MSKAIIRSRAASPSPSCPELPQAAPTFLELARHGAQSILRQAIEEEITEYLGRARYQHTGSCARPQRTGAYRNGTRLTRVDTPSGAIAKFHRTGTTRFQMLGTMRFHASGTT